MCNASAMTLRQITSYETDPGNPDNDAFRTTVMETSHNDISDLARQTDDCCFHSTHTVLRTRD